MYYGGTGKASALIGTLSVQLGPYSSNPGRPYADNAPSKSLYSRVTVASQYLPSGGNGPSTAGNYQVQESKSATGSYYAYYSFATFPFVISAYGYAILTYGYSLVGLIRPSQGTGVGGRGETGNGNSVRDCNVEIRDCSKRPSE